MNLDERLNEVARSVAARYMTVGWTNKRREPGNPTEPIKQLLREVLEEVTRPVENDNSLGIPHIATPADIEARLKELGL